MKMFRLHVVNMRIVNRSTFQSISRDIILALKQYGFRTQFVDFFHKKIFLLVSLRLLDHDSVMLYSF